MDLKKARQENKLKDFIKEQEEKQILGDEDKMDLTIKEMAKNSKSTQETSDEGPDENCNDTQTP